MFRKGIPGIVNGAYILEVIRYVLYRCNNLLLFKTSSYHLPTILKFHTNVILIGLSHRITTHIQTTLEQIIPLVVKAFT